MKDFKLDEKDDSGLTISIVDCADADITLRKQQEDWANWTESGWDDFDVDVGVLPVATGKSRCFTMAANWCAQNNLGTVAGLTPTKMLQDQYDKDFDWIPILKGANAYPCQANKGYDCARTKLVAKNYCKPEDCKCPYRSAVSLAKGSPIAIFNFHSYYFGENHRPIVMIDEGHNATNFVMGMFGTNLWKFQVNYPNFTELSRFGQSSIKLDPKEVLEWLGKYVEELDAEMNAALMRDTILDIKIAEKLESKIRNLTFVMYGLRSKPEDILVLKKNDWYNGHESEFSEYKNTEQEFLYIKPLKIDKLAAQILWPKDIVKKIVFLSSTIGEKDIEMLGLQDRKVRYFECDSPIPPERRPFVYWPVVDMSYKQRQKSLPDLIKAITKIADNFPDKKGIVHCTYDVAEKLRRTEAFDDRFMFHGKRDKNDMYYRFRETKEPKILIASGMSEGIDLAGPDFGFQVITMVTRPSLADDVNFWRIKYDKEVYDWETVRTIIQQTGRISRGPEDMGVTIMLDKQFKRLFYDTHTRRIENGKKSMWYDWFLKAIKW